MQLIEAALAFAITMLALSLVCSSFVEIIHRLLSMREAGFKYMLEQMFDQVLEPYMKKFKAQVPALAAAEIESIRTSFVERMRSNRAPMGVGPNATPTRGAAEQSFFGLMNGRLLTGMTPNEFMERLGSTDFGAVVKQANDKIGETVADSVDVVLKDVAQKFEAFGNEAAQYFEGRARLLSVAVAIALAFLAHVDAVDLFKTYLRDPNARAKVIEQSQAVTEQYKSAIAASEALQSAAGPSAPAAADDQAAAAKRAEELRRQAEALKIDALDSIAKANDTVKQYAGLGVPIGWNAERIDAAQMSIWVWTCKDANGESMGLRSLRQPCLPDTEDYKAKKRLLGRQFMDVWVQIPTVIGLWFYLFLGGLLIGLGSPFWYNAVTGLTSLRNAASGSKKSADQPEPLHAAANAQPITPVGAFKVASRARAGIELPTPPQNP